MATEHTVGSSHLTVVDPWHPVFRSTGRQVDVRSHLGFRITARSTCFAVVLLLCVLLQGVMGMSWCPQDHSLLLSCSKDHRTICWDVSTTDIVCEMPTQDSWSFDVQVGWQQRVQQQQAGSS